MENFPTAPASLLPRAANAVTLAVLVTATWWSSEQRPTAPVISQASPATIRTVAPATTPAAHGNTAPSQWSVRSQPIPHDGLVPVGYQTQRPQP